MADLVTPPDELPMPGADAAVPFKATALAPDVLPDKPQTEEEAPSWVRVRYDQPRGTDAPVRYLGFWWHDRSEFVLTAARAETLRGVPGFTLLGSSAPPV